MDKVVIGRLVFTNDKHIIPLQLISKPCGLLMQIAGDKAAKLGAKKMLTAARPKNEIRDGIDCRHSVAALMMLDTVSRSCARDRQAARHRHPIAASVRCADPGRHPIDRANICRLMFRQAHEVNGTVHAPRLEVVEFKTCH